MLIVPSFIANFPAPFLSLQAAFEVQLLVKAPAFLFQDSTIVDEDQNSLNLDLPSFGLRQRAACHLKVQLLAALLRLTLSLRLQGILNRLVFNHFYH